MVSSLSAIMDSEKPEGMLFLLSVGKLSWLFRNTGGTTAWAKGLVKQPAPKRGLPQYLPARNWVLREERKRLL